MSREITVELITSEGVNLEKKLTNILDPLNRCSTVPFLADKTIAVLFTEISNNSDCSISKPGSVIFVNLLLNNVGDNILTSSMAGFTDRIFRMVSSCVSHR